MGERDAKSFKSSMGDFSSNFQTQIRAVYCIWTLCGGTKYNVTNNISLLNATLIQIILYITYYLCNVCKMLHRISVGFFL